MALNTWRGSTHPFRDTWIQPPSSLVMRGWHCRVSGERSSVFLKMVVVWRGFAPRPNTFLKPPGDFHRTTSSRCLLEDRTGVGPFKRGGERRARFSTSTCPKLKLAKVQNLKLFRRRLYTFSFIVRVWPIY